MESLIKTKARLRILGLMTGSSADGLDVCLVEFSGKDIKPAFKVLCSSEIPYPETFQYSLRNPLELSNGEIEILDGELGKWFASEIDALNLEFDAIASHGQTMKHEPPNFSLQIGDPVYMARQFKVPVIHDFRTADIELGGQGAPLIPIADQYLFQNDHTDILALNIGGIANLTIVPAANNPLPLLAWDTGPGNTLIDQAVRLFSNSKLAYDPEGALAARGRPNIKLLDVLLSHEFYHIKPPRSAGQEQFGAKYFQSVINEFYPETDQEFKDFIHTLTVLTARSIAASVNSLLDRYRPEIMYIGGGGWFNKTLIDLISNELPALEIKPVDHQGIDAGNKEAFGFAYLGYLHLKKLAGNIPAVTGATRQAILGRLCKPT